MSINSSTSDLGHMVIVTTDAAFDTLNGDPYIIPTDPGPMAQNPASRITNTTTNKEAAAILGVLPFTAVETVRLLNQQNKNVICTARSRSWRATSS